MLKGHNAWSGRLRATEQMHSKAYFGMSTEQRLQLVLRSGYGEQTTNNEELIGIEDEMDAHK